MLAYVCGYRHTLWGHAVYCLYYIPWWKVGFAAALFGIVGFYFFYSNIPFRMRRFFNVFRYVAQRLLKASGNLNIGVYYLALFRLVNIQMNYSGVLSKFFSVARSPVWKPYAGGYYKVCLGYGLGRLHSSVEACHAEVSGVGGAGSWKPHHCKSHIRSAFFGKALYFLWAFAVYNAASAVYYRSVAPVY